LRFQFCESEPKALSWKLEAGSWKPSRQPVHNNAGPVSPAGAKSVDRACLATAPEGATAG
jgi:hypothetical protein